jgi:hypothetical protein
MSNREIWCDVNGYEGLYQISNLGNVLSLRREVKQGKYGKTRVIEEKILKPTDNGNGYLIVPLRINGKRKNFYIHRLVAEHFVPNCTGGNYVNHKDYDTRNNSSDNLEWCTQRNNILYSAHRMRKPHKQWKRSATGEKYIYFRYNGFRLSIRNLIDKTFPTLEEAVRAREVVLSGEKYLAG